jgi:hypothetical protein
MKYSESQAGREIDKISDQHAFNRYTIKAAMDDDDMAYLFECFFKHEIDLDTGKPVTKRCLEKQLIGVQSRDFKAKLRSSVYCRKPSCQTRRSGWVGVYYETFLEEPAD